MSKEKMTGKDELEMKRIAQELLMEASGQVDNPHEPTETETEKRIRLAKEAMEPSSGGTNPPPSSPEPAVASAVKTKSKKTTAKKTTKKKTTKKTTKTPAAPASPPKLDIPGVINKMPGDKVEAIVESICAQLKVQRRSDGNYSESMRNAAVGTVRQLDAPHPSTLRPEVSSAFWERYYALLADRDHMAKVAEWRLANDHLATSVAIFKEHTRLCAARALLKTMDD